MLHFIGIKRSDVKGCYFINMLNVTRVTTSEEGCDIHFNCEEILSFEGEDAKNFLKEFNAYLRLQVSL